MTLIPQDAEHCADILDIAANVTQVATNAQVAHFSSLAQPEQDGTESECAECGDDLGPRQVLKKRLCLKCQERLEKKGKGYGSI